METLKLNELITTIVYKYDYDAFRYAIITFENNQFQSCKYVIRMPIANEEDWYFLGLVSQEIMELIKHYKYKDDAESQQDK